MKNIFAYTEFIYRQYPAYLSLNKRDGRYFLSVRSQATQTVSQIEIPTDQLAQLGIKIQEEVGPMIWEANTRK